MAPHEEGTGPDVSGHPRPTPDMRPYTRPLLKSSRIRHFAAGAAGVLLLVALTAASGMGIAPTTRSEGIMDLSVDVRDVPCDEPFDESDRVQVIPDTMSSERIKVHVVVRNRNCCCCEGDVTGPLGELRGSRSSGPTRPTRLAPAPTPAAVPEVASVTEVIPPPVPVRSASASPLAARPGATPAFGGPADASGVPATASKARLPWWLALAAAPAVFFGRGTGEPCEDDETGARSGPSRTC